MPQENISILIDAVNRASKEIQQVSKDLQGLDKSVSNTQKTMSSLSQSLKTTGRELRGLGVGLTAAVTLPLVLLGKTMINQVGQIEQYKIALDVMLGSAEEGSRILKDLSDFARVTPFSLPGVVDAGKRLLAFGIEVDKLLPTIKALGDVSAGTGADLGRMILNFGQVKTQAKLTGRELRDFAVLGVPLIAELAKVMGVAENEIQDLVAAGKVGFPQVEQAFKNMTSEGGKFFNLMDKQSRTLKGIIENIKDGFIRVSLAIFGVSVEAQNFGEILEGGAFAQLKETALETLVALEKLVISLNNMSLGTRNTILAIGAFLIVLGPALIILGALSAAIGALLTPIGAIIGAVTVATVALIALRKTIAGMFKFIKEMLDVFVVLASFVKDLFLGLAELFVKTFFPKMVKVGKGVIKIWAAVKDALAPIFRVIAELGVQAPNIIAGAWKTFLKILTQGLIEFLNILRLIGEALSKVGINIDTSIIEDKMGDLSKTVSGLDMEIGDLEAEFAAVANQAGDTSGELDSLGSIFTELGLDAGGAGDDIEGAGGKMEQAAKDAKKLQEQLIDMETELAEMSAEVKESIEEISATIRKELGEAVVPENTIVSYESLKEGIKGVKKEVDNLTSAHEKFIEEANKGIDEYKEKIETLRDEAVTDVIQSFNQALLDQQKIQEELVDAEGDRKNELLEEQKINQQIISDFNELKSGAEDFTAALEKNADRIEKLKENVVRLNEEGFTTKAAEQQQVLEDAERERLVLLGKQILATDKLASLQEQLSDQAFEADLSDIDKIALQLAKEEEAANAAILLLEKQKEDENLIFQQKLEEQALILETFRRQEATLALQTAIEIDRIQIELEESLTQSYDRLITKLKSLEAAANAAFAAAQRARSAGAGGGAFVGGQFAGGGYTGSGSIKDVAGVVHKGEWVAPNWMVKAFRPMFGQLESMRRNKNKGFAEGGEVGGKTFNQPITMNNNISSAMDFDMVGNFLKFQLRGL